MHLSCTNFFDHLLYSLDVWRACDLQFQLIEVHSFIVPYSLLLVRYYFVTSYNNTIELLLCHSLHRSVTLLSKYSSAIPQTISATFLTLPTVPYRSLQRRSVPFSAICFLSIPS